LLLQKFGDQAADCLVIQKSYFGEQNIRWKMNQLFLANEMSSYLLLLNLFIETLGPSLIVYTAMSTPLFPQLLLTKLAIVKPDFSFT
jgi:hypothetical protein